MRSGATAARIASVVGITGVGLLALCFTLRTEERRELDERARANASGSFVQLSDGMVHYELDGPDSADAVVLVHGFSVPLYIWDTTYARLQTAGYRVLRYDLFGRGYSDRPRVAYDASLFTRQLDALLDSLRLNVPVHLVGLSLGGLVVANYAIAHPARVRTVTLVDPAYSNSVALPFPLGVPLVGDYLFAVYAAPDLPQSQLTDFLHPERHPDWPDRYRVQMRYSGFRRALLSTLREGVHRDDRDLYARFGALGIPTLLLWGREDQTVRFELSDSVRVRIPGVTLVPVDSAGHLPHIEQPEVTHAALFDFLARQRDTPGRP